MISSFVNGVFWGVSGIIIFWLIIFFIKEVIEEFIDIKIEEEMKKRRRK